MDSGHRRMTIPSGIIVIETDLPVLLRNLKSGERHRVVIDDS